VRGETEGGLGEDGGGQVLFDAPSEPEIVGGRDCLFGKMGLKNRNR
jgi:hypothetical protein